MKRLLFLAHRVPFPPDKGERVRAYHEIRALGRSLRVTVAGLAHSAADVAAASGLNDVAEKVVVAPAGGRRGLLRGAASLLAGRSVTEGYFDSPAMSSLLAEESRRDPFDVVLAYSSGTLPLALGVPAKAHLMDLIDVDSEKWAAYARKSIPPRRWLYAREARAVAALERRAVESCEAVFLVSENEVAGLACRAANVSALGNGVDLEYFAPRARPSGVSPSVVFTGTMDYRPNAEGVCWFVREVWPELRRRHRDLRFVVVGRDPTREVQRLAEEPGVVVTGAVADVRPYVAEATAAVAPLHVARGVQNKVLEAMAMGRAVVGSPEALAGIDLEVGSDALEAASPAEWVEAVGRLISDGAGREAIERRARACVESRYSWESRMAPLVERCVALAEGERERETSAV